MEDLQISFPKSNEDNRLQLVDINGSIFAIFHSPLKSSGPINLNCEKWSLILLAPIKSEANIVISGINIICLNEISSAEETVKITASNQLVSFVSLDNAEKKSEITAQNKLQFDEDPGSIIYLFQLFNGIIASARDGSSSSFSEAQKKFLTGLCALADKVKGRQKNLSLNESLDVWNIT